MLLHPPVQLPPLSFVADSSSKDDTYMVSGGFALMGHRVAEVERAIATFREDAGIRSEFHWQAYRGGARRAAYERLVDYAFDLIKSNNAHLHIAIARFKGCSEDPHARIAKDTRVNKIYYQLLVHRVARLYGSDTAIHGIFDSGDDCSEIVGKRNQVCATAYRSYKTKPNCVRTLEPMDSIRSGIIQMADVIVGGIGASRNERSKTSPKGELARYIHAASGHQDWSVDTERQAKRFTVWNLKSKNGLPQT